jgi:hypothetical protein
MTEVVIEVYEAFKAGGVPDAEAKAAAAALSERVNGVKSYGVQVAQEARAESRSEIKELAQAMHAGFESLRVEMKAMRADMKAGDDGIRADMKAGDDAIRADMKAGDDAIRADMKAGDDAIRADMKTEFASVRTDMKAGDDSIRAELAPMKADIATLKTNTTVMMWMLGVIIITLVVPALQHMLKL